MDEQTREIRDQLVAQLTGDVPSRVQIREALTEIGPASGTMAKWCQDHDDVRVHTLQFDRHDQTWWTPLNRTVDAHSYKGKVLLDGSAREFAGLHVVATSPEALIVTDDRYWIAYVVAEQT